MLGVFTKETFFKCEPYLQIKTADGSHAMWNPSNADVLAEDWEYIH